MRLTQKAMPSTAHKDKTNIAKNAIRRNVRCFFLSGQSVTAKGLNQMFEFNDARKVISELRAEGMQITDCRLDNGCKLYWLDEAAGKEATR